MVQEFTMFDYIDESNNSQLKITKPIRLIELFAGIGSQALALQRIGANFERYKICEFDKYAVASYNAVHGTNFGVSDITKITAHDLEIVDTDKYTYIMTYSFPCTDLSNAGRQAGMTKGSGTRSGLLWEVERLLNECDELPQILLLENVSALVGKKFKGEFDKWCEFLNTKGYTTAWQVLNAKNYGIPQNRERVFAVSWLDKNKTYTFPKPKELKYCLQDFLEEDVEEKFFLNDEEVDGLIKNGNIKIEEE